MNTRYFLRHFNGPLVYPVGDRRVLGQGLEVSARSTCDLKNLSKDATERERQIAKLAYDAMVHLATVLESTAQSLAAEGCPIVVVDIGQGPTVLPCDWYGGPVYDCDENGDNVGEPLLDSEGNEIKTEPFVGYFAYMQVAVTGLPELPPGEFVELSRPTFEPPEFDDRLSGSSVTPIGRSQIGTRVAKYVLDANPEWVA